MLSAALEHQHPCGIRYPKASALHLDREPAAVEIGKSEIIRSGSDGTIVAYGAMLEQALAAADLLADQWDVGVVNARFVKPIDAQMVRRTIDGGRFVVTVEEGATAGGFGSAFLQSANAQRLDTRGVTTLGLPDEFIEHGDRCQLLDDHGLSPRAIAAVCRRAAVVESVAG
jgi:1-deoxy-D-xylulose-5-phosphate synthase